MKDELIDRLSRNFTIEKILSVARCLSLLSLAIPKYFSQMLYIQILIMCEAKLLYSQPFILDQPTKISGFVYPS